MQNKTYYTGLIILTIAFYALITYVFHNAKFFFAGVAVLIIYIWCKDEITGTGWFKKRKLVPPAAIANHSVGQTFSQFTATVSGNHIRKKEGYRKLMQELVNPLLHPKLEAFIHQLNTFEGGEEEMEPIYSLGDFTDEEGITFISLLDWRSVVEDLEWRIESSLKQNYEVTIDLPSKDQWGPEASVSDANVFKTYNTALKIYGFQLGFLNTGNDDYALLVFRIVQQPLVVEAVTLTGYGYFEIPGNT